MPKLHPYITELLRHHPDREVNIKPAALERFSEEIRQVGLTFQQATEIFTRLAQAHETDLDADLGQETWVEADDDLLE